jgi:hypothetical protein
MRYGSAHKLLKTLRDMVGRDLQSSELRAFAPSCTDADNRQSELPAPGTNLSPHSGHTTF